MFPRQLDQEAVATARAVPQCDGMQARPRRTVTATLNRDSERFPKLGVASETSQVGIAPAQQEAARLAPGPSLSR